MESYLIYKQLFYKYFVCLFDSYAIEGIKVFKKIKRGGGYWCSKCQTGDCAQMSCDHKKLRIGEKHFMKITKPYLL